MQTHRDPVCFRPTPSALPQSEFLLHPEQTYAVSRVTGRRQVQKLREFNWDGPADDHWLFLCGQSPYDYPCWDSLLHVGGGAFKDAKLELLQPLTPTHVS